MSLFSRVVVPFYIPSKCVSSISSTSPPTLSMASLFRHFNRCVVVSSRFNFHFPDNQMSSLLTCWLPQIYLLWRNVCSKLLPMFKLFSYWVLSSLYILVKSFSTCDLQISPSLPLHSFKCDFWRTEVLNFDEAWFIVFLNFMEHVFGIISNKSLLNSWPQRYLSMYFLIV